MAFADEARTTVPVHRSLAIIAVPGAQSGFTSSRDIHAVIRPPTLTTASRARILFDVLR